MDFINVAPMATASTSAASNTGSNISNINDGVTTTAWSSTPNVTFPQTVDLTFAADKVATVSSVSLVTHYASQQGITQFDVQYYQDGIWLTAMQDAVINWKTTGWNYEEQTVSLPAPVTSGKFRLVVKKANLTWGNFVIDELKLTGFISDSNAQTLNIAPLAVASTTAPTQSGLTIARINDGSPQSNWSTATDVTLPQTIDLNFAADKSASVSKLSIVTHYASQQGITKFDLRYLKDGLWLTALKDVVIKWQTSGANYEEQVFEFAQPVSSNQFRLVVKAANLSWGNFVIDELKLFGTIADATVSDIDNIAPLATVSTTAPTASVSGVANMIDRADSNAWSSAAGVTLPRNIDLDFGDYQVATVSKVALVAHFASQQGIRTFSLQYYEGGTWKTALQNVTINWQTSGWDFEEQVVSLPAPVSASKFRLVVTAANMQWNMFVVDELKLIGKVTLVGAYKNAILGEDKTSLIKNPGMGWVLYHDVLNNPSPALTAAWWNGLDNIAARASIIYIRTPWSKLEPQEGHYAWREDENYRQFIQLARQKGIKLAFRVVVDAGTNRVQATPDFVRAAGAKGLVTQSWVPYLTDAVFQRKFEAFVAAFAAEYDDANVVDYLDAEGLGLWGEMHNVDYMSTAEKTAVFNWITNLYQNQFKQVLLGDQFAQNSFSLDLHNQKIKDGWIIRRDSFGAPEWFLDTDKNQILANWPTAPVFAEGAYSLGFPGFVDQGGGQTTLAGAINQTLNDALQLHANTLDLRNPPDANVWIGQYPQLFQKFTMQGGYRFVPTRVTYPGTVGNDGSQNFVISHAWKNVAVGKLPNDARNWNHKYKLAFAVLNADTGELVKQQAVSDVELATWLQGPMYQYNTAFDFTGVPAGDYQFAVGIINTKNGDLPEIKLALTNPAQRNWYVVGGLEVTGGQ